MVVCPVMQEKDGVVIVVRANVAPVSHRQQAGPHRIVQTTKRWSQLQEWPFTSEGVMKCKGLDQLGRTTERHWNMEVLVGVKKPPTW